MKIIKSGKATALVDDQLAEELAVGAGGEWFVTLPDGNGLTIQLDYPFERNPRNLLAITKALNEFASYVIRPNRLPRNISKVA